MIYPPKTIAIAMALPVDATPTKVLFAAEIVLFVRVSVPVGVT
jgi:hypothetical protein